MTLQADILKKATSIVPQDRPSRLSDVREWFNADAEAVYQFALIDLPSDSTIALRGLQVLCRTLSVLIRDGFQIESRANSHVAQGNRGGYLILEEYTQDRTFLELLYCGDIRKADFQGRPTAKACLDFFLAEFPWDSIIRDMRLLRVAPDDASAVVSGSPGYQRESLIDCAREIVRSPYRVSRGLRSDGLLKEKGWAYCGVPSRAWTKDGKPQKPPKGFTFVVYADDNGYVFDWDWVKGDNRDPQVPLDFADRFSQPQTTVVACDLVLGNVVGNPQAEFNSERAWFSSVGDCVFCYFEEAESYAARMDEYLTAFFKLGGKQDKCVGFKLKVVSRFAKTLKTWARPNDQGIMVRFNRDRVEVDVRFLMQAWLHAKLPSSAALGPAMELMKRVDQKHFEPIVMPAELLDLAA